MLTFSIILAETSRSLIYLRALASRSLYPDQVFYLRNNTPKPKMGQLGFGSSNENLDECVRSYLNENQINYNQYDHDQLLGDEFQGAIGACQSNVIIYSGYGGVILPKRFFQSKKVFLHAHGGILPKYKGSTTNYYSLLSENFIGASTIIMTENLDTGPILNVVSVKNPTKRDELDHILDAELRAESLVKTILDDKINGKIQSLNKNSHYFVIHPVLKHISILQES